MVQGFMGAASNCTCEGEVTWNTINQEERVIGLTALLLASRQELRAAVRATHPQSTAWEAGKQLA
jgi:hypothetical protein